MPKLPTSPPQHSRGQGTPHMVTVLFSVSCPANRHQGEPACVPCACLESDCQVLYICGAARLGSWETLRMWGHGEERHGQAIICSHSFPHPHPPDTTLRK